MAQLALDVAFECKLLKEKCTAVTYFNKSPHIRVIPYAPVALIGIPMTSIHTQCLEAAAAYGKPGNYIHGANIAGFVKVVDAMLDQGLV